MRTKSLFSTDDSRPALQVTRDALSGKNIVYIAKANKAIKYGNRYSKIAYIGQTTTGITRIAQSAATRAKEILDLHGFKHLDFFIIRPTPKRKVRTWALLEKDLLITFQMCYGQIPIGNTQGSKLSFNDMSGLFPVEKLKKIIEKYSS